jgi:hypothetical protein
VLLSLFFLLSLQPDCRPAELFHTRVVQAAAADDQYLYESGNEGILWRISRASGETVPLTFSPELIVDLASDGTTVWYVTNSDIHAVPVTGGASHIVADGRAPHSDGHYLYWIDDSGVRRMRVDGSDLETVAAGTWASYSVAPDAVYVLANDQVFRVAQPGGEIKPVFAAPHLQFVQSDDGAVRFMTVRQGLTSTSVDVYRFDPARFTTEYVTTRTVSYGLRGTLATAIVTADQRLYVVLSGMNGPWSFVGKLVGDYPDGSQWQSQEGPLRLLAAGDDGIYVEAHRAEETIERLCVPELRRRSR